MNNDKQGWVGGGGRGYGDGSGGRDPGGGGIIEKFG